LLQARGVCGADCCRFEAAAAAASEAHRAEVAALNARIAACAEELAAARAGR
jgi:hypothetical protein